MSLALRCYVVDCMLNAVYRYTGSCLEQVILNNKVVSRVIELDNYKFQLNEYRGPLDEVRDSL